MAETTNEVEIVMLDSDENKTEQESSGVPPPTNAITQIDSSISKTFEEDEERVGIIPYPGQGDYSLIACLKYICCVLAPPVEPSLLGVQSPKKKGKKCLVLDLDETLVHSSFEKTQLAEYQIPLELDEGIPPRKRRFDVYVIKRPGVDAFLAAVGKEYEIVVFTASIEKYAHPLLNLLDTEKVIDFRLYREACTEYRGSYVKDLRRLGRDLKDIIIVDNSPSAYQFQPENAIPCTTFMDDMNDRELDYCKDFLLSKEVLDASDVRNVLDKYDYSPQHNDI